MSNIESITVGHTNTTHISSSITVGHTNTTHISSSITVGHTNTTHISSSITVGHTNTTHISSSITVGHTNITHISCFYKLTGEHNMAQPIANPVKNRPIKTRHLNPVELSQNCATANISQPMRFGINDITRAGLRPNPSAAHPAIPPPNTAPNGANACGAKRSYTKNEYFK